MILHRCAVPKTIYHGRDKSITIDYEKGYIIEQSQFEFDMYVQKHGHGWALNIGGTLAMAYPTLKKLRYSVLSDLNAKINGDKKAISEIKWVLKRFEYLEKNNGYVSRDSIFKLRDEFEKEN